MVNPKEELHGNHRYRIPQESPGKLTGDGISAAFSDLSQHAFPRESTYTSSMVLAPQTMIRMVFRTLIPQW